MNAIEWVRAFTHDAPVGVVLTTAGLDPPEPVILYANAAFGELVGREAADVVGLSPRFMQGRQTLRSSLDLFRKALESGERFHGYLTNYKGDGTRYRAEVDCRPLHDARGHVEYFVSFEREVLRRIGRPAAGMSGRYEPVIVSNDLLTCSMRRLGVFEH